jgi:shikimate dehydrogenase
VQSDGDIAAIQACISNRLDVTAIGNLRLAGVIGEAPSHYSKSPALWNAAFREAGIGAIYFAFDVEETRLKDLTLAFRDSPRLLGVNVTVPHKLKIMDHLDELDLGAARIGAVNTIVRTNEGRLIGYNTDGEGFLESILKPQPDHTTSFIESLDGVDVLLLGAGGSARAIAFHVAEFLNKGRLLICNRTIEQALGLTKELQEIGCNAEAISEKELPAWATKVELIINSTTKGQGGVRKLPDGKFISMEPYSALAPANPAAVPEFNADAGTQFSDTDVETNHRASLSLASSIPKHVGFYDLIYFPEETVFLRHGRMTGHRTQNGKAMIVCQAAIAFCKRICLNELQKRRIDNPDTYRQVLDVMYRAW